MLPYFSLSNKTRTDGKKEYIIEWENKNSTCAIDPKMWDV